MSFRPASRKHNRAWSLLGVALLLLAALPASAITVVRPVIAGKSVSAKLLPSPAVVGTPTYALTSQPTHGTVTLDNTATGDFTYAPEVGARGRDSFTFEVTDDNGTSAAQTVYLTVLPPSTYRAGAVGLNDHGQTAVGTWLDIVAVSAGSGGWNTAGLKADGTVVVAGDNSNHQADVDAWRDIVAVSAGYLHTVGLQANGQVVAVGWNGYGQTGVSGWSDIVAVSAGYFHTVGLKADGSVVAVGKNSGQLDVTGWSNIVAVAAGGQHTVGVRADGTVLAVGANGNNQAEVGAWSGIVGVAAGAYHTLGLKADGTVVGVGFEQSGVTAVSGWSDIVAVAAGYDHIAGLKSDGSVVAAGFNTYGQTNMSDWSGVVAVAAGNGYTVGLKAGHLPTISGLTLYAEPNGTATTVSLPSLGSDADGDTLSLSDDFSQGSHGAVTDNGDGTLSYTPEMDYVGDDSFTYSLKDGREGGATGTVTVHVGYAEAPTFNPAPGSYEQHVSATLTSATGGATLRYTTDGVTRPTRTTGTEAANGAVVEINASATVEAVAYKTGFGTSAVSTGTYTIVPLKAPSGLTATVAGANEIDLAWKDMSAIESGYKVFRATGSGSFSPIAQTAANATSFKDKGLTAKTAYKYYVVAYNALASSSNSNTVTKTTSADTTKPSVISVAPASGATGVKLNSEVSVNFSEALNCATVTATSFTLKNAAGSAVAATLQCNGATATLVPKAALAVGKKYTARVTTAIKDKAGNALAAAKSWSFTAGSTTDTTAPKVTATTPAQNAVNVSLAQTITVAFSEALDCSTVTTTTVTLVSASGSARPGTVTCSGAKVSLDPAVLLAPGTVYKLTLATGITDLAHRPLAGKYVLSFTTKP